MSEPHPDIRYPESSDMPHSHLPFSPAVIVGNLIFVSGQASVDKTGKIISDTFEGECRRSIENLIEVVEKSGSRREYIVQTRNYVRDPEDGPTFNRIYAEYFSHPLPARTTISRCLSDALKFEIECVAVLPPSTEQAQSPSA